MNQVAQTAPRTASTTTSARQQTWVTPRANIREEKDAYILELEMPGVTKDGLEVTVSGNELTIAGHRSDTEPSGTLVYRESRTMDYRRVFDLDPAIDTSKITAKIEQGVAKLLLPKAERVKPRTIAITE